jgi:hypothetical protein
LFGVCLDEVFVQRFIYRPKDCYCSALVWSGLIYKLCIVSSLGDSYINPRLPGTPVPRSRLYRPRSTSSHGKPGRLYGTAGAENSFLVGSYTFHHQAGRGQNDFNVEQQ